jgi:hypothetical protein
MAPRDGDDVGGALWQRWRRATRETWEAEDEGGGGGARRERARRSRRRTERAGVVRSFRRNRWRRGGVIGRRARGGVAGALGDATERDCGGSESIDVVGLSVRPLRLGVRPDPVVSLSL